MFGLAHGLLGLLGGAATFAPLMADTGLWWHRRRGIAMAVCASGNYLAGTLWPPLAQWGVAHHGWRPTYVAQGLLCGLGMALLALCMRRPPPALPSATPDAASAQRTTPWPPERPFGLAPAQAQALLCVAGVACCVAMAVPQVHIVAYCTDLGFGAARGAEMLSPMLASGIASRLVSGGICDHIGGVRALLLGSALQGVALLMFLPTAGLVPLYVASALFGLFQGGIVPSYAIIVREHFPAREAGARTGAVIMATLVGMALGGWMSGWVFDVTGSYRAAFVNGIGWNLLNLGMPAGCTGARATPGRQAAERTDPLLAPRPIGHARQARLAVLAGLPLRHAPMKISARNVLPGKVIAIVRGPVSTEVTLEIAPGIQITSSITSNSAEALQLKEGGHAYGIIKAPSVMIGVDD